MKPRSDIELMEYADSDRDLAALPEPEGAKVAAVRELGELVRGRLELAADDVQDARFTAMWREVDRRIEAHAAPAPQRWWRRFLERHRGHLLTGVITAGAVAALAIVLRGDDTPTTRTPHEPIEVRAVVHRPAEIEALETPGGTSNVFNLDDEDGATTVIWVTPEDTVEGI